MFAIASLHKAVCEIKGVVSEVSGWEDREREEQLALLREEEGRLGGEE